MNIFYNYFRDYDPITGRYIESDPISLDGGLNTYGYVGGDVLRLVDPHGLKTLKCSNIFFTQIGIVPIPILTNLFRHDYLLGNNTMLEHLPDGNPLASNSLHLNSQYNGQQGGYCSLICDDPLFDNYVINAAKELQHLKYSAIGFVGILNYYNCQAWIRAVLDKAKKDYLRNTDCPKCKF